MKQRLRTLLTLLAALTAFAFPLTSTAATQTPLTADEVNPGQTQLAVIGAGWLGGTVASAWVKSGYKVMLSSRHPDELKPMADKLGANAVVGTPKQAAHFGQVVLIAVPYNAIPQVANDYADALAGKVVLDATNSWGAGDSKIAQQAAREGDGVVNARYFKKSRFVRAFSAVDATVIKAASQNRRQPAGVPLASNDDGAMAIAAKLVKAAGCEPVIVGNLQAGRRFEHGHKGFRANTTADKLRQILSLDN